MSRTAAVGCAVLLAGCTRVENRQAPQNLPDLLSWANGILVAYGGPGWLQRAELGALVVAIAVAVLAAVLVVGRRAG